MTSGIDGTGRSEPHADPAAGGEARRHPSPFEPAIFVPLTLLCIFGAVIGTQLLVSLGMTANTSIIGALAGDGVEPRADRGVSALSLGACAEPDPDRYLLGDLRSGQQPAFANRHSVRAWAVRISSCQCSPALFSR